MIRDHANPDPHEAEVLKRAVSFSAYIRRGPHAKDVRRELTREAVNATAQAMANEHGRPILIYAIDDRTFQAAIGTAYPEPRA